MADNRISQAELKTLISYEPTTGIFTWIFPRFWNISPGDTAGSLQKRGSIDISLKCRKYKGHHLAWMYMYGKWPENVLDHINGDPTDNRIENLRDVTVGENCRNQKLYSTNKTGLPGIFFDKTRDNYQVRITCQRKIKNIGRYADFFEACCARLSAQSKMDFHLNHGKR